MAYSATQLRRVKSTIAYMILQHQSCYRRQRSEMEYTEYGLHCYVILTEDNDLSVVDSCEKHTYVDTVFITACDVVH